MGYRAEAPPPSCDDILKKTVSPYVSEQHATRGGAATDQ
jgi:hypothetical protein